MLFQFVQTKKIVFLFTESWSRDQLMQKPIAGKETPEGIPTKARVPSKICNYDNYG